MGHFRADRGRGGSPAKEEEPSLEVRKPGCHLSASDLGKPLAPLCAFVSSPVTGRNEQDLEGFEGFHFKQEEDSLRLLAGEEMGTVFPEGSLHWEL